MIIPRAILTASGRPQLAQGEVERALLDKVDVEFEGGGRVEGEEAGPHYKGGYAIVTSHRLIWIDASAAPRPGRSCALPLVAVAGAAKKVSYGLNIMAPKVRVEVRVYVNPDLRPCAAHESFNYGALALRCRGPAPDAFVDTVSQALAALQRALQQQLQAAAAAAAAAGGPGAAPGPPPGAPPASFAVPRPPAGDDGWGAPAGAADGWAPPAAVAGPGGGSAPRASAADVDASYLSAIVDMGFPRNRAVRALIATRCEGVQQAIDWMLAYGDAPGVDDPLDDERGANVNPPGANVNPPASAFASPGSSQRPGGAAAAAAGGASAGFSTGAAAAAAALAAGAQQYPPPLHAGLGGLHGQPPPPQQQQQQGQWGAPAPPGVPPGHSPQSGAYYPSYGAGAGPSATSFSNPLLQPVAPWGAPPPPPGASGTGPSPSGRAGGAAGPGSVLGVAGIMAREQTKAAAAGVAVGAAFADLRALMSAAQEMVELAEHFRAQGAAAAAGGSSSANSANDDAALDAAALDALASMGIVSPVTRATAGGQYPQQLARQLADFLEQGPKGPLARSGGILMLPDVYCLFNRARGSELVSPDDLLAACELLEPLGLPLRLRRFASGVVVIQGAQHTDAALCRRIGELAAAGAPASEGGARTADTSAPALGPALSATAVGMALGLPVALAREALLVAEAAGVVCRDDGPEGLRFFRNFFGDPAASEAAAAALAA